MKFKMLLIVATLGTALLLLSCASPTSRDGGDDPFNPVLSDTIPAPYTVSVDTFDTMSVGLHSFAFGETSDGRWIAIGGRVDGFHGFSDATDQQDFPNTTANRAIRVYDPATKSLDTLSVDALPNSELHVLLSATNYQHNQVGETLYVTGGYGLKYGKQYAGDPNADLSTSTHPFLAVIDTDALADAVAAGDGAAAEAAISYTTDPYPQGEEGQDVTAMTGGELMYVTTDEGPLFYQVFGHQFDGTYRSFGSCDAFVPCESLDPLTPSNCVPTKDQEPDFQITTFYQFEYYANFDTCAPDHQLYANEIRRFRIGTAPDGTPVVEDYVAVADTAAITDQAALDSLNENLTLPAKHDILTRFRRRDLPVSPRVGPDGEQGFTAWGGVFRPLKVNDGAGMWTGFSDAIHYTRSADGSERHEFVLNDQVVSSIYATAHFVAHDTETNQLYTTLIGGINAKEAWTDWITTFVEDTSTKETKVSVQDERLPNPLGSEGEFVPNPAYVLETGVGDLIDYAALPSGRTTIGYLFGSIEVGEVTDDSGSIGGTTSSHVIYEVVLTKP